LVVGIILDADWSRTILGLVLLGGDGFRAAMLDFDFGKYIFTESFCWVQLGIFFRRPRKMLRFVKKLKFFLSLFRVSFLLKY
jgi:hypothetical protein